MDKLTLDHLAPYLPYGLQCHNMGNIDDEGNAFVSEIVGLDQDSVWVSHEHEDDDYAYSDTFPILRPLSDLTKEIEHNGETFVPKNRIDQYTQVGGDGKLYLLVDGALWSCNPLSWDYYLVVRLISWHFDVFGLIDKGLAIDYNTVKGGF